MGLMACFFLEAFLALTGLSLVLLSLSVYRLEKGRRMLQQLGLFFLAVGVWNIGENDFSVFVIHNPVLLYMMAFTGLFFVIAPLYGFALNAVPFRWRRLLTAVFYASAALPALALLLQLAGLVMMMQSLFFFHVFHPVALLLLTAALIHEAVREENRRARWMLVPGAVLLVSAVVEVLNYYAFHSFEFSLIFLFGSFVFLLLMLVLAGVFLHKDAQMRQAYERQQHESELMAVRLSAEKKRHDMMMREERRLAKLRHDLKHHVALLTSFIADGDPGRAQDYLAELSENIRRKTSVPCCENVAVSAVIEHYAALARQDGINVVIDGSTPYNVKNSFYAYPNATPIGSDMHAMGSWYRRCTRIIIEADMDGTVMYYQVNVPSMERNHIYSVSNIVIKGLGSKDPEVIDYYEDGESVSYSIETSDWDGDYSVTEES